MQNEMYQSEPNLLAEMYRNQSTMEMPRRIERHFDFLNISEDGTFLLGTSNLSGRIWSGSIWVLQAFTVDPKIENCTAGIEFESSIACGLWLDKGSKIIVGCDSGSLQHLTLIEQIGSKSMYIFRIDGIVTEHDDSIITLDLMKNKTKIISGGMDMNIKICDEETLLIEKSYCPAHGHVVTSVTSHLNQSEIFASTSLDGTSLLWDIRLEKPASLLFQNAHGYTTSTWVDDNYICLGSNDGSISLIDLRVKQELEKKFCSQRPIFKLQYNPGLDFLAVCADDPIVHVFTVKGKPLLNVYESEKHTDLVRGLAWNPCDQTLYSCGWDSKIYSHEIKLSSPQIKHENVDAKPENKN